MNCKAGDLAQVAFILCLRGAEAAIGRFLIGRVVRLIGVEKWELEYPIDITGVASTNELGLCVWTIRIFTALADWDEVTDEVMA